MKDQEIIKLYWDRDEAVITATADTYGNYCYWLFLHIWCTRCRWYCSTDIRNQCGVSDLAGDWCPVPANGEPCLWHTQSLFILQQCGRGSWNTAAKYV